MKISYTKITELTIKQAIIKANAFLAKKNVDCRFEIIKPHLNKDAVYVIVNGVWFADCGCVMYYPSVTNDKTEFKKALQDILIESYYE